MPLDQWAARQIFLFIKTLLKKRPKPLLLLLFVDTYFKDIIVIVIDIFLDVKDEVYLRPLGCWVASSLQITNHETTLFFNSQSTPQTPFVVVVC